VFFFPDTDAWFLRGWSFAFPPVSRMAIISLIFIYSLFKSGTISIMNQLTSAPGLMGLPYFLTNEHHFVFGIFIFLPFMSSFPPSSSAGDLSPPFDLPSHSIPSSRDPPKGSCDVHSSSLCFPRQEMGFVVFFNCPLRMDCGAPLRAPDSENLQRVVIDRCPQERSPVDLQRLRLVDLAIEPPS